MLIVLTLALITLAYLRRAPILAVLAVMAAVLLQPGLASAADEAPLEVAGHTSVTLTPIAVTILTGLLLPFIVALITKAAATSWQKGLVGIVVAAIAALVERITLADGSAVITGGLLLDWVMIYGPQLLTYLGLWDHLKLNDRKAFLPARGIGSG